MTKPFPPGHKRATRKDRLAPKVCPRCGVEFHSSHRKQVHCSRSCGGKTPKALPAIQRFWASFEPELNTGCWLWTASLAGAGYGQLYIDGRHVGAHRFSYQTFRGEVPRGMLVCHRCDTRPCVNPDHLFVGTYLDNLLDCIAKGRHRNGWTADKEGSRL